jgi:LPS-assembly lipoprotein
MWWLENRALFRRSARLAVVFLLAGLTAACFQPLYGTQTIGGGPALRDRLASVDVLLIDAASGTPEARIGVELRNALIYDLSGGESPPAPNYRLRVQLVGKRTSVIIDPTTARPDVENYGIDATYTLIDVATGKPVLQATTFARVSYDVPGQQQRFARARGLRDAENRAAKVVSEQIRSRLASYFVAGT